jgi:multiple sugar transport system ATP-binding protein
MIEQAQAASLLVQGMRTAFGKTTALHDVTLGVEAGETLVLFGPSGAGKTVLLRAIAGLDPNAQGRVVIGGRDVSIDGPERRGIGVAFQNFALYPHMSARENIASPLRARRLAEPEIAEKVGAIARLLKIDHVLAQQPRALSNGQKQRTALARALVTRCAMWTPSCATRCGWSCRACSGVPAPPPSMSLRTTGRRWRSATASPY